MTAELHAAADAWWRRRQKLMTNIRIAILDIGNAELRARLDESFLILQCWDGPMKYAGQTEGHTRYLAVNDALEAYAKLRLLLVRGSMSEVFRNLATRRIR